MGELFIFPELQAIASMFSCNYVTKYTRLSRSVCIIESGEPGNEAISESPCRLQYSMHISNRLLIQFSYSIEKYGQSMFTVTVQWERPTNDEAGNNNYSYTIAVTDFEPTLLLPDSATAVTLTLSYNEVHTVSVAATNCVGTSSTSELSIYRGNTLLQCSVTNMIL